jgi:glycosyltransferase involved in cell wall biosynthesis
MPAYSKISIVIPVLNSGNVLKNCLQSIRSQNYPQDRVEILILDGGSVDETLSIAKKFSCKIFQNPLKTAEAGKAVGVKSATGQYIIFIDSDNILPQNNWLTLMLSPFSTSPEIIGAEPIEFTYRRDAGFIERYSALLGANDPYAYFLGNYDRQSTLSGKWTGLNNIPTTDCLNYLLITLSPNLPIPTIGANGTIFRADFLKNNFSGDYLFDIDIINQVLSSTNQPLYFAKVNIGIIHTFCESSLTKFIQKQSRRVKDIFFYEKIRTYPWKKTPLFYKNILFGLYSLSIVLPFIDAIKGYSKLADSTWLFHPAACIITFYIYSLNTIKHKLKILKPTNRQKWSQ